MPEEVLPGSSGGNRRSDQANAGAKSCIPAAIRQSGPRALEIVWADGHRSSYDVVALRRACPCAACVDEWTGRRMLADSDVGEGVRPVRIDPVGRYAIQIEWSDGHATGIYAFELLRSLCPCEECVSAVRRVPSSGTPSPEPPKR